MLKDFNVPLINPKKSADKIAYVYKHTFIKPDGKIKSYIGQTTQTVDIRWKQHISSAYNYANKCRVFERAIRKYGAGNFTHETLLIINENMVDYYEALFIKLHDTISPNGYNLREGGDGACSPEMRAQMVKGNNKKLENKAWREDQAHNEKIKYVYWYHEISKKGTLIEGYRVSDHPKGGPKTFGDSKITMDEKYKKAAEYILFLELLPPEEGYFSTSRLLPKYMYEWQTTGFAVRYPGVKSRWIYTGDHIADKIAAFRHLLMVCPDDRFDDVFPDITDIPDECLIWNTSG